MKKQLYVVAGLLMAVTALVHADPTDFLRPEDRREDYSQGTEQAGLLHQEYTDKSGNKHRRFAPVESIFGINNRSNDRTNNNRKYDRNEE